ncbi:MULTISPECIES: M12 family metallo-peptidase [unclassified Pseudomonas]|uniref:M12 family metallo-peptidase n=1 Tax=unclassified Pseudomonas TaxID=196821 RepID=UPI000BD8D9DC|nr:MULTISPECIES: M12 family metallo-peptidase [unclassified Pseudomonas]PVZ11437.1 reprolysin-like metallo-peptidase family M12B [Pseudomonas sp. URIL14HWK12:I12]PVZ22435.1 reprolysin-like metallo-peptidase family M12B [Pseudomonas sp. URIL14HWK12:I10]PVZ31441.1 reprolysin-like metallo-peptidase family M12B [Pseudomonas sp. URIL14HWK12:I11]SNZ16290.1 Metallo-peptidase family M12 [Pseudomonas sp. URIL14HWK12:I9]
MAWNNGNLSWAALLTAALLSTGCTVGADPRAAAAPALLQPEPVNSRDAVASHAHGYLARLLEDPANVAVLLGNGSPALVNETTPTLDVPLPNGTTAHFAMRNFVVSDQMLIWQGETPSERKQRYSEPTEVDIDPFNNAQFVRDHDLLIGTMRVEGIRYELVTLEDGRYAVLQVDENRLPPEGEPEVAPSSAQPETSPSRAAADEQTIVRLLYVTTADAREKWPDLQMRIVNEIELLNRINKNSKVYLTYRLAGIYNADYAENGQGHGSLLAALRNTAGPLGRPVDLERQRARADMVTMVIRAGEYCGMAYLSSTKTSAFSVVNCMANSTAHELGHNFGANHNKGPEARSAFFPYGYGYRRSTPPSFRTQLSATCASVSCPRIDYFSTPRLTYNGLALGTPESNDVARLMNERKATMAGFFPAPDFVPLVNRRRLDLSSGACLQLNGHSGVATRACDADSAVSTSPDKQWGFTRVGNFYQLRNQSAGAEQCLQAVSETEVGMGPCSSGGDPAISADLWRIYPAEEDARDYRIANEKYGQCLTTIEFMTSVQLLACRPGQFWPYDRWISERFPLQ